VSAKFTRSVFVWLDQVVGDKDLPSSAFKVAYVIAQSINEETGEGFPGTKKIAARIAMSQPTVIAMVRQLQVSGHLGVLPGRAGRGHSNRYRMIVKLQPAEFSQAVVKHQPAEGKHQPAELKSQPADMNYFNNHLNNHSAASPRALPVLKEEVTDDDRERAYAALCHAYPNKAKHHDSRVVLDDLIDEGFPADDVIAEATAYAAKCTGMKPKDVPYLCYWLKVNARSALDATCLNGGRAVQAADTGIAPNSHYEAAYGGDTQ
jgi:hypothetical protein